MAKAFYKVNLLEWIQAKPEDVAPLVWEHAYQEIMLPQRKTRLSAGYDIHAPYSFSLAPGESTIIETGLKIELDPGLMLGIFPRSGMGFKYFIRLANTVGVIDADYFNNPGNEGHIFIKMRNEGKKEIEIDRGDAFAQGIILRHEILDNDTFDYGDERVGGIGSTD